MSPHLCARLLALPSAVRATLAGVPGPGWLTTDIPIAGPVTTPHASPSDSADLIPFFEKEGRWAWFPANPTAAVTAVLDCTLAAAHESLMAWLDNHEDIEHPNAPGLDSDAALSIIEAHAARSQS